MPPNRLFRFLSLPILASERVFVVARNQLCFGLIMKLIQNLPVLMIVITLQGCASSKVWYQADKSFEQTRRDLAACRADAARLTNPFAMVNLAFALADDANKKDYIENCMIAKGYFLVEKNSVPVGIVAVPK